MSRHLYPHVFGSGPTIVSPLSLRRYAKRMALPCGFTTVGDMNWTPAIQLESTDPLLWLRFWESDYSVSTGGARLFTATDKTSATLASFAAVNLSTTDFSIVANIYRTTTGNQVIAAKYQDATNYWRFEITAGHKLHFIAVVSGSTLIEVTGTTNVSTTATWYHCAVVVDRDAAGTTEVYLNGVNDTAGTPTVSASTIDNTGAFFLAQAGDGTLYFDGRISRVGVFKADLLTQTEITWLYNLGRSRIHGSLGEVGTDGASLAPTWWANCNESSDTASIVDQAAGNTLALAFGELITNGGFETAGGGGADVFGSWSETIDGDAAITDETVVVDAGGHAVFLAEGTGGAYAFVSQSVLTVGHRYTWSVRARNNGAGTGGWVMLGEGNYNDVGTTASYATYTATQTTGSTAEFRCQVFTPTTGSCYFDTVSVTAVDIPACDGPSSDIAPDTGSVGTAHGQLIGFADSETVRSTDVPSAIGSGTSLGLDGVDDYVTTDDSASLSMTAAMTFAAWIKPVSVATTDKAIAAKWNHGSETSWFCQQVLQTAKIFIATTNPDAGATSAVTGNVLTTDWQHIAIVFNGSGSGDSGRLKFYHNGTEAALSFTGTIPASLIDSASTLRFGAVTELSRYFDGKIDDVQLFNSALSLSQVGELYAGTAVTGATPIHKWTFDEETSLSVSNGDPIAIARSLEGNRYQFLNATASERPECVKTGLNGKQGLRFDSIDDMLAYTGTILSGTSGSAFLVYTLEEVPNAYQTILAQSDTATANKYVAFHARGNTANPHIGYEQVNADTVDLLDGNTDVTDNLDCAVYWDCDGTTHRAWLNGTAQTLNADTGANNGDLYDDTAGEDVVSIGGLKHTSETNHAGVVLYEIYNHPLKLTDASRARIAAYVLREYGLTLT